MTVPSIVAAAALSVIENERSGPRFGKWSPFLRDSIDAKVSASAPGSRETVPEWFGPPNLRGHSATQGMSFTAYPAKRPLRLIQPNRPDHPTKYEQQFTTLK